MQLESTTRLHKIHESTRKYTYTYNLLMKSIKFTYITLPEKEEKGQKDKMTRKGGNPKAKKGESGTLS